VRLETLEIGSNRLTGIGQSLAPRRTLAKAAGQTRNLRDEDPVLVLLDQNPVSQRITSRPNLPHEPGGSTVNMHPVRCGERTASRRMTSCTYQQMTAAKVDEAGTVPESRTGKNASSLVTPALGCPKSRLLRHIP
jgi:hypothetical protein